jgi:lipid-A-disaccharide synthase
MSIAGGICVVAGEASGDAQIAPVLKALRNELAAVGAHDVPFWGAAGPYMRAMGVECLVPTEDLAVMAFSEILPAYFRVRNAYDCLLEEIEKRRPVAVILVDYPGFNLKLARDAFLRGNTVLYHISPKVWAHGWNRVGALGNYTHLVTSILPFEESLLRNAGVNARFVGNPLADAVKLYRAENVVSREARNGVEIAILPGSRKSELRALVPLYLRSLFALEKRLMKPVLGRVPVAQTLAVEDVRSLFRTSAEQAGISLEWLDSHVSLEENATYAILNEADYCWVCSGTAALEVGLFGLPNSVAYRTSLASALIMKALLQVPYVSLGNLCARRAVVPEFLQFQANEENLVTHALAMLQNEPARRSMTSELQGLVRLFPEGAAERAAKLMTQTLLENMLPDAEKYRRHSQVQDSLLAECAPK